LKVKLLDGTVKTFLVDWSVPVSSVIRSIGEKMSLTNADEFGLQLESKGGEWLNGNTCLDEQAVTQESLIVLKKKFFFSDAQIDKDDPVSLHLLFVQV
jgi:talin